MKFWKDPNNILCICAVLAISLVCQSSSVSNPGMAYMMEDFANIPPATITMVGTLPSIAMIVSSLLFPVLRRYLSIRTIVIGASVLLVIFGLAPIWTPDFTMILVERFLFGIGMGFMWPAVQSSIVEFYEGTKRNTLLGFNSVLTAGGGIIWANTAGPLALNGWRASYYAYFIALAILVFVCVFLPASKPLGKKTEASEEEAKAATPPSVSNWKLWAVLIVAAAFVFNFCSMTFFTNISMKIVNDGLGTSVEAGFGITSFTIGSVLIGLVFGAVMKAKFMSKFGCPLGWILCGIGMFIAATATSFAVLVAGGIIAGIGCGTFVPAQIGIYGRVAGSDKAPLLIGVGNALSGFAQWMGPTLFTSIATAQGLDAGGPCIKLAAILMIGSGIVALILFVIAHATNKVKTEE